MTDLSIPSMRNHTSSGWIEVLLKSQKAICTHTVNAHWLAAQLLLSDQNFISDLYSLQIFPFMPSVRISSIHYLYLMLPEGFY